jgi:hypothetical protein
VKPLLLISLLALVVLALAIGGWLVQGVRRLA